MGRVDVGLGDLRIADVSLANAGRARAIPGRGFGVAAQLGAQ